MPFFGTKNGPAATPAAVLKSARRLRNNAKYTAAAGVAAGPFSGPKNSTEFGPAFAWDRDWLHGCRWRRRGADFSTEHGADFSTALHRIAAEFNPALASGRGTHWRRHGADLNAESGTELEVASGARVSSIPKNAVGKGDGGWAQSRDCAGAIALGRCTPRG